MPVFDNDLCSLKDGIFKYKIKSFHTDLDIDICYLKVEWSNYRTK